MERIDGTEEVDSEIYDFDPEDEIEIEEYACDIWDDEDDIGITE